MRATWAAGWIVGAVAYLGCSSPTSEGGPERTRAASAAFSATQTAQIEPASGAFGQFGALVALDGTTVVASGDSLDDAGGADFGVWVFAYGGGTWVQQAEFMHPNIGSGADGLGSSAAISGDTMVVGAEYATVGSNAQQGSAFVFVRSGTTWSQQAVLTASDGAATDLFGSSIAISGDTVVVGAIHHSSTGFIQDGAAYVFIRSGTTWTQQTKLVATNATGGDGFGISVSVSGNTALVGADNANVGTTFGQGAAYVFVRSGTTWSQQAELSSPSDAGASSVGASVSLDVDTALACSPGNAAYVFQRSGTTWSQQAVLTPSDGNAVANSFCNSSGGSAGGAVSGDTAVVGAQFAAGTVAQQGKAYVYTRVGSTWSEQTQITSTGAGWFGASVALQSGTAVLGAPVTVSGASGGAAFVFGIVPSASDAGSSDGSAVGDGGTGADASTGGDSSTGSDAAGVDSGSGADGSTAGDAGSGPDGSVATDSSTTGEAGGPGDASSGADSAMGADATTPPEDATSPGDGSEEASASTGGSGNSSGCGCRVVEPTADLHSLAWVMVLTALAFGRRRSRA